MPLLKLILEVVAVHLVARTVIGLVQVYSVYYQNKDSLILSKAPAPVPPQPVPAPLTTTSVPFGMTAATLVTLPPAPVLSTAAMAPPQFAVTVAAKLAKTTPTAQPTVEYVPQVTTIVAALPNCLLYFALCMALIYTLLFIGQVQVEGGMAGKYTIEYPYKMAI